MIIVEAGVAEAMAKGVAWPERQIDVRGLVAVTRFVTGGTAGTEVIVVDGNLAFAARKTRPYLLTGWLWYLVMLLPAIGIFQVGSQARADRYTYLPQIGVYLSLTWLIADASARWRQLRWALGGFAAALLAVLIFRTRAQTAYWQNSESLWTRALDCTSDNFIAQHNLGIVLAILGERGRKTERLEQALAAFRNALKEFTRERRPLQLVDEGPLVLIETRKDLSKIKLPFEIAQGVSQQPNP